MSCLGGRVAAAAVLLLGLGCVDTAPPLGPTVLSAWEGNLAPVFSDDPEEPTPLISGSVAALVRQSGTEVGIGLQAINDPDLVVRWGVHHGSCNEPGALIGEADDYASLDADNLERTSFLAEQLMDGEAYHVAVTDAEDGRLLSCGNLQETEL